MSNHRMLAALVIASAALGVCVWQAGAQTAATAPTTGPAPTFPAPIDIAAARKAACDRWKELLAVKDEEWTAMEPRLEKVQMLNAELGGGAALSMSGLSLVPRTTATTSKPVDVQAAARALGRLVQKPDASTEELKAAIVAWRNAKIKAKAELEAAGKELRELLSPRQEGVLIKMGLLE